LLDCNVPPTLLEACIERRASSSWLLAIDGTSIAKVRRLPLDVSNVDLLFINEDESATLGGTNAKAMVLLRGKDGATVDGMQILGPPAASVDTTGAGDALVAGTLRALLRGDDLESAVRFGMQRAARTVETHGAVSAFR
jgi:pseudouridine kinase